MRNNHFRYTLIIAMVALASLTAWGDNGPCSNSPASRQLDYWLGNWAISSPGSAENASSHVSLSLDKCVVVENWQGEKDHIGENIFGYNPESKSWMGFFADNRGHVHVFDHGHVTAGKAEFEGPSRDDKGEVVLNRIRIVQLSPGKVEQTWDKSSDNGVTWKPQFRLEYTRKSS
ncbi:MAG TPA: hypothetical protein VMU28_04415 [Terriglobales bacterium]|nr:hypothetical protein [Terriglobales bacterium]